MMMKAIIFRRYGAPDVLEFGEIDKPVPRDKEVLVRIHAAAANAADWRVMRGDPLLLRMAFGISRPRRPTVLGNDFAGHVEAVGENVTLVRPGDEVYGDVLTGTFAEYVCVPETRLAPKPTNLSFEQAATVPTAGLTALQALRDAGQIRSGQHILINGASSGVGTFAVQIAKCLGAQVTGVCSTANVDLVRSLGANHVIDYTREDFTSTGERYDVILDVVGNRTFAEIRRVLHASGTFVPVGGPGGGLLGGFANSLQAWAVSQFMTQRVALIIEHCNREDLLYLKDLIEAGKVVPVVDRQYKLSQARDAISYMELGHARGKVVITV